MIATCGPEEKVQVCREHGADHVIHYRTENFLNRVRQITANEGVDAVYDPVGGDTFIQSLRCMAPEGRIVPIGFASGAVPQIPATIAKVLAMFVPQVLTHLDLQSRLQRPAGQLV